jgi:hypothetical protein
MLVGQHLTCGRDCAAEVPKYSRKRTRALPLSANWVYPPVGIVGQHSVPAFVLVAHAKRVLTFAKKKKLLDDALESKDPVDNLLQWAGTSSVSIITH